MENKFIIGLLIAGILFSGVVLSVKANPSSRAIGSQTSSATTTTTVIASSTTATLFTYNAYANTSNITLPNKATLLLQVQAASTTGSFLTLEFLYSDDGIDFYKDFINVATTSVGKNLSSSVNFTWLTGTTATQTRAIAFDIPTQYVKVVASTTLATTSVWAQLVPIKERSE